MLVSPDYTRQNRAVEPTLFELLKSSGIRFQRNKAENTVIPEWGSTIFLASADRPESLRGSNLAAVGIDEISLCDESVYFEALGRIRDPRAKRLALCGVGTPDGGMLSWCYRRLVEQPHPNRTVIFGKTSDNVALQNTGYVQNLTERYDTKQLLTFLEGKFVDFSGALINPAWFGYYDDAPSLTWNFALDTSYGVGKDNSAMMAFGINENAGTLYIKDVETVKLPFPDLCRRIETFTRENGYTDQSRIYIEPKASGVSIVQQLRETTNLNVIADQPPSESKEARLLAHSAKIEAGRVYLRKNGRFIPNFLAEIALFPNGRNDDQVDCLTMALRHLQNRTAGVFGVPRRSTRGELRTGKVIFGYD